MSCATIAHAGEKFVSLSEDNVREFIETTTDITTKNESEYSQKKILKYLENHVDKRARFKSIISYRIPGFPPQVTEMVLNKKDFIEDMKEGAKTLDDYNTEVEIQSINIAPNKQQAIVITTSLENGSMAVSSGGHQQGETINMPVEGTSQCTQTISLNKKTGLIQMYNAVCTTDISFTNLDF